MRPLPPELRRALPWIGLVAVLLFVGLWPYLALIDHIPWGPDATKWVDRGTLDNPGWVQWVFHQKHFIGYRPLTALSFVLNHELTGFEPWGYRLTDLTLHLCVGALLFDVHRRLTRDDGAWGLLALVVLFAHPATEEVVPFVARRSYLLQAVASLGSIGLAARAVHASSQARAGALWLGVALLTAAALLSNEGGFVVLCWLPFLVWWAVDGPMALRARHLLGLVPAVLLAAAVLARRVAVLGSITGGYGNHYFAFVKNGRVMWRDMNEPDHFKILWACLTYALAPHGVTGESVIGLRLAAPLTAAALCLGLLLWAVRPPKGVDRRQRLLGPLLLVWLGGAVAIVVASGTWFWRQAYFLLPPMGIAFAVLAQRAVQDLWAGRYWAAFVPLPYLVLLPVAELATGPVLFGMNEQAHEARITYGAHVHLFRDLTAQLEGPGTVFLAIPGKSGPVHNVRIWANRFGDDRRLIARVLARRSNDSPDGKGRLTLEEREGRPHLVIDGKHIKWDRPVIDRVRLRGVKDLDLSKLHEAVESRWVYVAEEGQPVRLVEVPAPKSGKRRDR